MSENRICWCQLLREAAESLSNVPATHRMWSTDTKEGGEKLTWSSWDRLCQRLGQTPIGNVYEIPNVQNPAADT